MWSDQDKVSKQQEQRVIKENTDSNGKLTGYGFYPWPFPQPNVLLMGLYSRLQGKWWPVKGINQRRGNPENSGISNDGMRQLKWPEFWGVASGDQHAKQAGESQPKVSNGITSVGKFQQCQCELRSLVGTEAKCQQAEWFGAPHHWLVWGYFHAPEK